MASSLATVPEHAPLPLAINVRSVGLTDEQFERLCADNRELRLELTAEGELEIMGPTGPETGWRNAKLIRQLGNWAEEDGSGIYFDSSACFTLPNGAKRSPDASWIRRERWDALAKAERERFAPICPEFVIELRSPSDTLPTLQAKMAEYLENGAALGWLIDPTDKSVYVYRPGRPVERLAEAKSVSGDPILPGFVLELDRVWG